ncbi:MAG: hypothetical protein R2699_08505 [Acidimicrobiales bacterium]
MNHRAPWLVLDADAALAAVLADAVGELHAGVSGLIQIRSADDATRQALATICTVAERHGTRVVRWPSTDPMPWHELDVLMGAAAGQGTAVLVVAEALDRRSRSDRAGLTGGAAVAPAPTACSSCSVRTTPAPAGVRSTARSSCTAPACSSSPRSTRP